MVTISIVSHGHADLVEGLLKDIALCAEVSHLVLTCNIPEREIAVPYTLKTRLTLIRNTQPKGFGANHNAAFAYCRTPLFCVVNPDVRFPENPFPVLINTLNESGVALVAPTVINSMGIIEDSVRYFPTLLNLTYRLLRINDGRYLFDQKDFPFEADWVGGMFMLLKSDDFTAIGGFDEHFFLYYEDVDLCARLWKKKQKVFACPSAFVVHDARRASRRNLRHLSWHIASLVRYFTKYFAYVTTLKKIRA